MSVHRATATIFPKGEQSRSAKAVKIALDAVWGLVTIVIILGGILFGVFTADESGAVACVYAFLVTMFIYRDYQWSDLPKLIAPRHSTRWRMVMI